MIYPSQRAVWIAAAGAVPAFLVALLAPSFWYVGLLWICLLGGFALADAAAGPGPRAVQARLVSAPQVAVGGSLPVDLIAEFAGAAPARIEARVAQDARLSGQTSAIRLAKDGFRGTGRAEYEAIRRGMARLDRLWLRWPGPFGLMWKQAVVPVDHRVAVLPDIATARDQAIAFLQRDPTLGDHVQNRQGQGREFDALTDYQPGMGRRSIDWKRSARHARLLAKEYSIEQNSNVVLAIDSGRLMCEPVDGVPRVDRAVTAALLMAYVGLHGGDLVSLFGFDSRPRVVGAAARGVQSFAAIQHQAALIDYSSEETNFTLALTTLDGLLTRRSLVVIFTDFVDTISAEQMLRTVGRLAERHILLFLLMKDGELEGMVDAAPDTPEAIGRAVTAGALLRERRVVIERLRRMGCQVIEAEHGALGPALVRRYLKLKQEEGL